MIHHLPSQLNDKLDPIIKKIDDSNKLDKDIKKKIYYVDYVEKASEALAMKIIEDLNKL
jgi:hypothetical protein